MNDPASEALLQSYNEVAEKSFEISDYGKSSQISKGLAETHEQFSDVYTAGTSDGVMFRQEEESGLE